jgi:hypothetical protein
MKASFMFRTLVFGVFICGGDLANAQELKTGLEARITPCHSKKDIFAKFTLVNSSSKPIYIWDTKYSKGYRSWTLRVTTSGKVQEYQRARQQGWIKNIPTIIEITRTKPYIIRGWGMAHGFWSAKKNYYFSFQKLGADLKQIDKIVHRIQGRFSQNGGQGTFKGRKVDLWKGELKTDWAAVEVKPQANCD